jgi:hypothetical protein
MQILILQSGPGPEILIYTVLQMELKLLAHQPQFE